MGKILVTGSGGFLGKQIIQKLLELNFSVVALDKKKQIIKNKKVSIYKSNIVNFLKKNKLSKFDGIIHLAAESRATFSYAKPLLFLRDNIMNLLYFLEAIKKCKKKPFFIFASALDAQKKVETSNPYLISKNTCEKIIKFYSLNYNIKCSVLVLSDLYSKKDVNSERFLYKSIKLLKSNQTINITNKKHTFLFFDIENLTKSLADIINNFKKNSYFQVNCFSKERTNVVKLVRELKKLTNSKSKIKISTSRNKLENIKPKIFTLGKQRKISQNLKEIVKQFN